MEHVVSTVARPQPSWPTPEPRWPFPELHEDLAFLAAVDHQLHAPDLAVLSERVVQSGKWRDYVAVCEDYRDYRLVFENDFIDVWVLSWLPGQETGFHDHDISEVGLCVAEGAIREHHMHLHADDSCHIMQAGESQQGPFGYIHRVEHFDGDPAVSVHSYSPPLAWVGQYREQGGQLLRLRQPGRTRLAPA
jgi:predicted metal-dependent enzyme (double-stranded beta helix superfamily)